MTNPGDKYLRTISDRYDPKVKCQVDVYEVLRAYKVSCPAVQHAIKKLLCAGLRNKGSRNQDLREAVVSINRAIEFEVQDIKESI